MAILTNKRASLLLLLPSVLIGILLIELSYNIIGFTENTQVINNQHQRAIFFDGRDTIFKNYEDIFTYVPNSEVRVVAGYISDGHLDVTYDYLFRTNNFGLVQDTDIIPERESLLLLGDSFTEGQGTEPWFPLISPEINKLGYQPVNGGLMGTGFAQWRKLERYIATKNVRLRKLVVIFISDDYHRPVFNFSPATLRCLSALPLCRLGDGYFFRLPPRDELSSWIRKIESSRGPMTKMWFKERAERLLPASYHLYRVFTSRKLHRMEEQSQSAIAELVKIYGPENVAFLHLPQVDEIKAHSAPNDLGLKARRSIQQAGGHLFDGFTLCQLRATDYGANDGHPNRQGYAKIAVCATNVINSMVAQVR